MMKKTRLLPDGTKKLQPVILSDRSQTPAKMKTMRKTVHRKVTCKNGGRLYAECISVTAPRPYMCPAADMAEP